MRYKSLIFNEPISIYLGFFFFWPKKFGRLRNHHYIYLKNSAFCREKHSECNGAKIEAKD
jgi:hypothetical protein